MPKNTRSPGAAPQKRLIPLVELVKARLREFYREPAVVFWVFVFPLLMAVGLGAAFRSQDQPVPVVGVVKAEGLNQSPLVDALVKSTKLKAKVLDAEEARVQLARTKLDLVVTVKSDAVDFRFDPKKESGPVARMIADDVLQEAAGRTDPIATDDTAITDKGSRYIDFLIPGLIGLNLMGSSMWGVGFNLVVARKRKLLRRYAVTPMRRLHFLLSYFFSRSLFLVFELGLLVTFGLVMFGTKVQGDGASLLAVAVLGAAAFAGISLMIGARLDNTETANGWMNFVQLPMYVLGGTFFSYERFPEWLHKPLELLPLTALVNALRSIYNEGASLVNVLPEVAVLSCWCLLGFTVALKTFRWQ
jgi:ABC-2 type transport system permease protein